MSENFDKYLAIANHDIQMANNMGELKSYVASILYDNDKKTELLQQKENIIKEIREDLDKQITFCINEANGTTNDKYCRIAINYLKHLKEILDKENKNENN